MCQQTRPRSGTTIRYWPPAQLFQRIHLDWAYTKEIGEVLVIVDTASGWIKAFEWNDKSARTVITCLEAVFTRFGLAETIVTDNAKVFTSDELNQWSEAHGVIKIESPPYFPCSNGLAERAVQTVKRSMKCYTQSQYHQQFAPYLRNVLFHHRLSSNACGISPAEIVFGRKL